MFTYRYTYTLKPKRLQIGPIVLFPTRDTCTYLQKVLTQQLNALVVAAAPPGSLGIPPAGSPSMWPVVPQLPVLKQLKF